MTLIIIILLLFILSIFMVDFIPVFYTWQSRIKIGKFRHDILWKEAVLKKALHWLNHLPSTKIKDSCMSSKESVLLLKECFRFSNIKLSI